MSWAKLGWADHHIFSSYMANIHFLKFEARGQAARTCLCSTLQVVSMDTPALLAAFNNMDTPAFESYVHRMQLPTANVINVVDDSAPILATESELAEYEVTASESTIVDSDLDVGGSDLDAVMDREGVGGNVPDADVISVSSWTLTSETQCDIVQCDVAEIFSPPRICARAEQRGLVGGFSHDLDTGFDLSTPMGIAQSWHELEIYKPRVLLVCPPCTWYSKMQNINRHHYSEETIAKRQKEADALLEYALRCCREQLTHQRGFVFEHPSGATSWKHPSLQSLIAMYGVESIDFDQCATDLRGPNGQPIRKRTRLVSNMPSVIEAFADLQCACRKPHLTIEGACMGIQLAKYCQVYTPLLVDILLDCADRHITYYGLR